MYYLIHGATIIMQGAATVLALLQMRFVPRRLPWFFIATASFLMVSRRIATVMQEHAAGTVTAADWLSLGISICFLSGVIFISQLFQQIIDDRLKLRQSEEQLRTASKYARTLLETSLDPLVTINPLGKITDVNRATELATGLSREQLIGSEFATHFSDPAQAQAGVRKVFEQGQVTDYPLAIRHVSGSTMDVLYNAALYHSDSGEVLGAFAAARDISERKRAEKQRELLEARDRQLQKTESLSRMAGAIAHHFNNQLGAVMGNLELALTELPSQNETLRHRLSSAMAATGRAANLSGLMLTYLGQTIQQRKLIDLVATCRHSLPLLLTAMPKSITFTCDFASPGPSIFADVNEIQQVLSNLLTNAWESMRGTSGTIRLTIRTVPASQIPSQLRFPLVFQPHGNSYACLEVTDTGCGIPASDLEKLFDPFFTTKFTGRGMGLPVVLGIVRSLKGVATVESKVGQGSTFRVFFPVTESAESTRSQGSATELRSGTTVLLVDDEEEICQATADLLAHKGFKVFTAGDGLSALEQYQQHTEEIDLVICDLTMPRMNGWDTLSALRRLNPSLPFILASGYSESQAMEGQHTEMPQAFLHKPYRVEHLIEAIGKALAKAS